jgi:predicted MFS family arabinose efflux permease
MLLVAMGIFVSGAACCSLAPNLATLAVARSWQGFGGGGLISLSVALIAEVVPPRERGRFQAWIAAVFSGASAFGPVAGGLLTQHLGWRFIFLIYLPLGALAAWLAVRRLTSAAPGSARGFRFDWPGLLLFAGFVAPALLALDQVRRLSGPALALAAGLAMLAALALWLLLRLERRVPDPLLPLGVLGNSAIWRANLLSGLVNGAMVATIAFLPIYLQAVRNLSPGTVGLVLLPLTAGSGFGAMIAGQVMARTGLIMAAPGIGLPVAAVGLAVLATGAGALPLSVLPWLLGAIALGFGTSFPPVQITAQLAAGPERLGSATASVQFCRSLGAASGTALLGAVLFTTLAAMDGDAAGLFVRLVNGGRELLDTLAPEARSRLQAEMVLAFQAAFAVAAAMTAVAAVICWRVPMRRM